MNHRTPNVRLFQDERSGGKHRAGSCAGRPKTLLDTPPSYAILTFSHRKGVMAMSHFAFDPKTKSYSPKNAYALGRAALLAYEDPQRIAGVTTKSWGIKHCRVCDRKGTQAFVIADDTKIIVAFRGTEPDELKDWFTNLKTGKTAGPKGMVHKGFLTALRHV